MRGMLTLLLVMMAGVVAVTEAAQCAYTTYTSCGFLWWWTCTRISYRYCEHGGWTAWAEHSRSACSKTCGGGTLNITRTRSCTNPSPYGGGRSCYGVSSMRVVSSCNTQPCAIDGGWSDWGDWEDTSKCTVMCGGGEKNQSRDRSCTNPQPQFGGSDCDGENTQNITVTCNTQECGSLCPEGENTFIADTDDDDYYYHCQQGQNNTVSTKAILMQCPEGTLWKQDITACAHKPVDTSPAPAPAPSCTEGTSRADPDDCTFYLQCHGGNEIRRTCGAGTKFDNSLGLCNIASLVTC